MSATRIASTGPEPYTRSRSPAAVQGHAGYTVRHCLDGRRVSLAGGVWLLLLYSLWVALLVGLGYAPGRGMLPFWDSVLPGFDGGSSQGIALGFPLAFLYGAGGAWLFAAIYNLVPARQRAETEAP